MIIRLAQMEIREDAAKRHLADRCLLVSLLAGLTAEACRQGTDTASVAPQVLGFLLMNGGDKLNSNFGMSEIRIGWVASSIPNKLWHKSKIGTTHIRAAGARLGSSSAITRSAIQLALALNPMRWVNPQKSNYLYSNNLVKTDTAGMI